jgi:hypothetical protein
MSFSITHEIGPLLSMNSAPPQTLASVDLLNQACRGVKLYINLTSGSASVTIQGKDPKSGAYWTILTSAALSTAGSLTVLTVYPGIAVSANVAASDVMPGTWRVQVVTTLASTLTINGCLIR